MLVSHIDGNPLNCDIENLQLITRADMAKRNSIARYPAEYRKAFWNLKRLNKIINKKEKQWQETN